MYDGFLRVRHRRLRVTPFVAAGRAKPRCERGKEGLAGRRKESTRYLSTEYARPLWCDHLHLLLSTAKLLPRPRHAHVRFTRGKEETTVHLQHLQTSQHHSSRTPYSAYSTRPPLTKLRRRFTRARLGFPPPVAFPLFPLIHRCRVDHPVRMSTRGSCRLFDQATATIHPVPNSL